MRQRATRAAGANSLQPANLQQQGTAPASRGPHSHEQRRHVDRIGREQLAPAEEGVAHRARQQRLPGGRGRVQGRAGQGANMAAGARRRRGHSHSSLHSPSTGVCPPQRAPRCTPASGPLLKLATSSSTPPTPPAVAAAPASITASATAELASGPAAATAARLARSGTKDLMRVMAPKLPSRPRPAGMKSGGASSKPRAAAASRCPTSCTAAKRQVGQCTGGGAACGRAASGSLPAIRDCTAPTASSTTGTRSHNACSLTEDAKEGGGPRRRPRHRLGVPLRRQQRRVEELGVEGVEGRGQRGGAKGRGQGQLGGRAAHHLRLRRRHRQQHRHLRRQAGSCVQGP